MKNLAWSGEVYQGWLTMTYLKNLESMMIHVNKVGGMTEEILQSKFKNMLSDRDVMLGFQVLFGCMRNK